MEMLPKRTLAIFILSLTPLGLWAQDASPGLNIITNPPGAEASLIGAVTVTGLTPVNFNQSLEGNYRLVVKRAGYETYKSSIYIQAGRSISMNLNLKSKTRLKAAARSLIIPGWGQSYMEQKLKGLAFGASAAISVAALWIIDSDFDDKKNEYERILAEYNRALTFLEKERLYSLASDAKKKAYDAETARRIAFGAAVAVWGLNLLDIVLFYPQFGESLIIGSVDIRPEKLSDGASLSLSYKF
jgi:nitrogen fixation-related uncharacterized protein